MSGGPAAALTVTVDADIGGLKRGLAQSQAQVVAAQKQMGRQTTLMGQHSKRSAGAMATLGASAKGLAGPTAIGGVGLALTRVIRTTAGFSRQMAATKSVTGATRAQMAQLRKQALGVGTDFGIGATQAAQAQTELAKGGLKTSDILSGGFKSALNLAAAGELDMADAATYTVNALKTFGIQGGKAQHVADAFAMAANETTADVKDFGMALTQGGAAAKAAGYNFDDTMTVLGALAEIGVKGSDAGTSMKAAMLQLVSPTKQQAEAAKKAHLAFVGQNGEMKSAAAISAMLRQQTEGMTRAQRTALFSTLAGTDGLRTLLALYDAGPKKLRGMDEAWKKQGYAVDVAKAKQEGLHGDMAKLSAEFEKAQIVFGTALAPGLIDGLRGLRKELQQLSDSGDLQRFGEDLGTIMSDSSTLIGPVAKGIGLLADGFHRATSAGEPFMALFDGFDSAGDAVRKISDALVSMPKTLPIFGQIASGPIDNVRRQLGLVKGEVNKVNGFNLKLPITLVGKDHVMKGMADIQAIKLAKKIQHVLGRNTDAQSKVDAIKALKLPPKLARILGQNGDAISKIAAVKAYMDSVQSKTVTIGVKVALQGSIDAVRSAASRKVGGRASGRGPGRRERSLVGEGLAGEWVGDSRSGAMQWVDRPTVMDLGPDNFVIPTESRYRNQAARIAQSLGMPGFAKGKKKKRNRVEQTEPTARPGTLAGDKPLNPLLPAQSLLEQQLPEQRPTPPLASEVAVSQAQASGNLGAVQAALQQLVADRTRQYQQAVAGGDPQAIKDAADNLTSASAQLQQAGEDMKAAANAIVQANLDKWSAALIQAKITTPKDLTDDLAALNGALGVATQAYNEAVAANDVQNIIQFGSEVLSLQGSIDDLKKSVDDSAERERAMNDLLRQQLDEARKDKAARGAASDAIIGALTDAANRKLGGVLGTSLAAGPPTGVVARIP